MVAAAALVMGIGLWDFGKISQTCLYYPDPYLDRWPDARAFSQAPNACGVTDPEFVGQGAEAGVYTLDFRVPPNTGHVAVVIGLDTPASDLGLSVTVRAPDEVLFGPVVIRSGDCAMEETTCRGDWNDPEWLSALVLDDPIAGQYRTALEVIDFTTGKRASIWDVKFSLKPHLLDPPDGVRHQLLQLDWTMRYSAEGDPVLIGDAGFRHPFEAWRTAWATTLLATSLGLWSAYTWRGGRAWWEAAERSYRFFRETPRRWVPVVLLTSAYWLTVAMSVGNVLDAGVEARLTGESTSGDQGKALLAIAGMAPLFVAGAMTFAGKRRWAIYGLLALSVLHAGYWGLARSAGYGLAVVWFGAIFALGRGTATPVAKEPVMPPLPALDAAADDRGGDEQ